MMSENKSQQLLKARQDAEFYQAESERLEEQLEHFRVRISQLEKELTKTRNERDEFYRELHKPKHTLWRSTNPAHIHHHEDSPVDIMAGTVAVIRDKVYIRVCRKTDVHKYHTKHKRWSIMAPHPYEAFTLVSIEGILTSVGGDGALLYNLDKREWKPYQIPDLPTRRYVPVVLYSNCKLVVAGGLRELSLPLHRLDVVEVLDTKNKQWSTVSSLPFGIHQTTAVKFRDHVYISVDHDHDVHIIRSPWEDLLSSKDSTQNIWIKCSWTSFPLCSATVEVFNNKLLAIGGRIHSEPTTAIYCYDEMINAWEKIGDLSVPRTECCTAVLPNNCLIVVGSHGMDSRRKIDTFYPVNRHPRTYTM